ncbi:hypothetical protein L1887_27675 [Cichorium endivia]|nr:hypothetical protein L1887_27675 [Cichorium endivia]
MEKDEVAFISDIVRYCRVHLRGSPEILMAVVSGEMAALGEYRVARCGKELSVRVVDVDDICRSGSWWK